MHYSCRLSDSPLVLHMSVCQMCTDEAAAIDPCEERRPLRQAGTCSAISYSISGLQKTAEVLHNVCYIRVQYDAQESDCFRLSLQTE